MQNSKIEQLFKELILEIGTSFIDKKDGEFLEGLRKLTNSDTVESMIERFKKLAGINK